MSNLTLGLDLGPNSIGWALIDEPNKRIVDLGVRIFPEGVDAFDTGKEQSRNEQRREARGMRRQIARRGKRRRALRDALVQVGLFPRAVSDQEGPYQRDPYELRAKALDHALTPHELGRVFFHLNQRRGFLSNRKKDRGDKEVKGMLGEISDLAADMTETGARTLGEYLHRKAANFDHAKRLENDHVRNRHTRRDMLHEEFEAIWDAQQRHHPGILTKTLRYGELGRGTYPSKPRQKPKSLTDLQAFGLHGMIFFQRTMYWPKSVVGLCELEPKEHRCPRGDRAAQRFRLLQEINNLKYIDPDNHSECKLSDEQRTQLIEHLSTREKATFDQIRKTLGFLETVRFNLEKGKRPSIKGMVTDWMMAKAVGKPWHDRSNSDKDEIVRMLVDNEREDDAVVDRLISEFGMTAEHADSALDVDFPAGYIHLSLKAIEKLLPHLERGLVYQSQSDPEVSAIHAAGYLRRDELQRRIFDELPDPARTRDCPIGDIPNPVVKRALVELRKVVNGIIKEHGKPGDVHVEMGRALRMGPKARREYNSRIREREKERDDAADAIRTMGLKVNRDGIIRLLLWKQQQHECVYCAEPISQEQLFGGDVDVDHILPYSRCLDDSQANKVVCHRRCNAEKGQRTPYEWLADTDPTRYEQICQHTASLMRKNLMPYGKYRRFLQKELDLDSFIARQLVDTGYIARATGEYLRCLFEHTHDVLGLKGQHTAELRWQWGLNKVLRDDGLDLKNRDDHRHHAVDAVVIALTNRSRLQQLSKIRKAGSFDPQTGEVYELDELWGGFRDDVAEKINTINVSHRVERKVAGALHEETFYGPTNDPDVFVVRKPLESLSPSEVPLIRDAEIRRIIQSRLEDQGIEVGRGKKVDSKKWKQALGNVDDPVTMASGVPIKKVRVYRKEQTIRPIREGGADAAFVKPGSTHHLCIFEIEEKGQIKRQAVFVTMLEAMDRIKHKRQIIQRTHPEYAEAKFVMSLSSGEMVLAEVDGQTRLLSYNTAASTSQQMRFFDHTDARRRADRKKYAFQPSTLNARKVTVDPLGRIRWAND